MVVWYATVTVFYDVVVYRCFAVCIEVCVFFWTDEDNTTSNFHEYYLLLVLHLELFMVVYYMMKCYFYYLLTLLFVLKNPVLFRVFILLYQFLSCSCWHSLTEFCFRSLKVVYFLWGPRLFSQIFKVLLYAFLL